METFDPEKTVSQNYVKIHENRLNAQEKSFIEAMNQSYYSFYSILHVERDKSLQVRDILLGTLHTAKERQGTHTLKRGDIFFGRILTLEDQSIFVGIAPLLIPIECQTDILDFKDWLIEENEEKPLTPDFLREESDTTLVEYFFKIVESAYSRPLPILMNTDDELMQFSKSFFSLTLSPEEALNLLLPLTLEDDSQEFLQDAKRDKSGGIKRIEIPWLVKGNKKNKNWDNTVLGHIIIEQGKVTFEANSLERTDRGKKLLSQHLGDAISFQKTLIETPEQKMKSLPKSDTRKDEKSRKLLESPEVQEYAKKMARAHWKSWFDEPIPVLENQTPREATKTEKGRERLEALLLLYERKDAEKDDDEPFKADISYLRRELGLVP